MRIATVFAVVLLVFVSVEELAAQRVNNVLYNPNARIVRAKMGPFGGVRFAQRGYLSPRFYDSLDRNLPIVLDFVGESVLPIVTQTSNQNFAFTTDRSGEALRQLKEETRKLDRSKLARMSQQAQMMELQTSASNNQLIGNQEFQLLDGTRVQTGAIRLNPGEVLMRVQSSQLEPFAENSELQPHAIDAEAQQK